MYAEFLKDVCEHIVDEFGTCYDGPLMDTIPGYVDLCFTLEDGETLRVIFAPNGMVTISLVLHEADRSRTIALTLFSAMDKGEPAVTILDTEAFREEDQAHFDRVVLFVQSARGFLTR